MLESNFYAWRVTGDQKYLDRALSAAQSLEKFCKVNDAFAGINDVRVTNSPFIDDTQSFFFAEVMKYLYDMSSSVRYYLALLTAYAT